MILGLPWESWLLLLVAVGLGPAIELLFLRNQRRRRGGRRRELRRWEGRRRGGGSPDRAPSDGGRP